MIKFSLGWGLAETGKFFRGLLVSLSGAALMYITSIAIPQLTTQPISLRTLGLFVLFSVAANALKLLTTESK